MSSRLMSTGSTRSEGCVERHVGIQRTSAVALIAFASTSGHSYQGRVVKKQTGHFFYLFLYINAIRSEHRWLL